MADEPTPQPVGGPATGVRTDSGTRPAAAPHRFAMFAVVSLALLMSSLDQTIVATALDALRHGLHTSVAWAGWTLTAYSLGLVLMLALAGKLADRYGRRRVFVVSVIMFTAASFACGLVDNIYVLIGMRLVQAAGGAGFTPAATGIVVDHFGPGRDKAVGLFGSIFPIGAMIGPIVGGLLVEYWSWRAVFFVNVPVGAVLLAGVRFIPADRIGSTVRRGRLDVGGAALLGLALVGGMLAITYLGDSGLHARDWRFAGPAVLALVAGFGFLRHIRRHDDPFVAPRLVYGRGFGAVNVVNFLYCGAAMGMVALVPLYAISRYHLGALDAGTLLTAEGIAVIAFSVSAAALLRRTGYRSPMYVGAVLVALGMAALAAAPFGLSDYQWLACAAGLAGAGIGWAAPATRNACIQLVPDHAAALAALRSTGLQVGSIVAVGCATAIIAGVGAHGMTQAWIYLVFAAILLGCLPVIARVPEHRGSW